MNTAFPMFCGSGGSKSRLTKAAGAEPSENMRDNKLHGVVARSRFRNQNAEDMSLSEHFWKFRCRKRGRCCHAKHISQSKVLNTGEFRALLEVPMLETCMRLWREAHFEVKICKALHAWSTFGR